MQPLPPTDIWLTTPRGRLFARRWTPATAPPAGNATIVLLHDSLGCVELWRDFPERLAAATGHEVIAYDRLGFGKSDPYPGRLGTGFIHEEARESFHAVREALDLQRFALFGHSVGGGMAVACAAAYPANCRALVTESAQAFVEDRTVTGILEAKQVFAQPGQPDRLGKYHGDKATWVLGAWIDTWLSPDFANWTLDADLARVQCPALVLHGDRDEYGSARHPQRIAAATAPHSSLHLLPDCGHVPHRERRDAVLAIVADWLAALRT